MPTINIQKNAFLGSRPIYQTSTGNVFLINKEDTVLVVAQNSKLSITTSAIALENGQLGDMISIENLNSKKVLKAIITGRKKVSPITNM